MRYKIHVIYLLIAFCSGCATLSPEMQEKLARLETYIAAHPEMPESTKAMMRRNQYGVGMNYEQVRMVAGEPKTIEKFTENGTLKERWLYDRYYAYFEDGIVSGVTGTGRTTYKKEWDKKYRQAKYFEDYSDTPDDVKDLIINGKIRIGMTSEQVLASWGKPEKNNKSVYTSGVHEQWVYPNYQYVYFEDGVMTSFSVLEE